MLIGELIQRIQSLYSKGVQSDDTRLSSRHIYNKLLTVRNRLTTQKLNKKQKISQWNYQLIDCAEVVKTDYYECNCIPVKGCQIYRTKYKIPKIVTELNTHVIQYVTSLEGSITFSETTWEAVKYKSGSKYTKNKPDFFIKNGYFYFITNKIPDVVIISAIFENPLEAYEFQNYCIPSETDCSSNQEKEFPIDADLIEPMIELTVKELILLFSQGHQDILNNTTEDTEIINAKK